MLCILVRFTHHVAVCLLLSDIAHWPACHVRLDFCPSTALLASKAPYHWLFGYIWCGYCWYAGLFSAILTVKIEKKYVDLKRYFIHKFQYTKIHSMSIYTKMFSTLTHYFVYTCNWTGSAFFSKIRYWFLCQTNVRNLGTDFLIGICIH